MGEPLVSVVGPIQEDSVPWVSEGLPLTLAVASEVLIQVDPHFLVVFPCLGPGNIENGREKWFVSSSRSCDCSEVCDRFNFRFPSPGIVYLRARLTLYFGLDGLSSILWCFFAAFFGGM